MSLAILVTSVVFLSILPTMSSKTCNFALLDGPVVLSMLFPADWIRNLTHLYLFLSQPCDLKTVREKVLL